MSRLDEEKLALLRRWGEGLTVDDREELRAAGRAILMLSDEIERLHIDLWHAGDARPEETDESDQPSPDSQPESGLAETLRSRLASFRLNRSANR